jgi:hypothetical protein
MDYTIVNMTSKFKLPALLVIIPAVALPIWYYINTDAVASVLFGEKLLYCNIAYCEVTRSRFLAGAMILGLVIVIGIILLIIRSRKA